MALGPGKYDDLATYVRETAKARAAFVIVLMGEHGSGFSVQGDLDALWSVPELLEMMAAQIRADRDKLKA